MKTPLPPAPDSKLTPAPFNYDTLIEGKHVTGRQAEIFATAAEYRLDGVRLGGVEFEMASASIHDGRLSPKREEVDAAAHILARLSYTNVQIVTVDATGTPLERPDLDVVVDGNLWGFEIARGIEGTRAKENAEEDRIVIAIRDLLDAEPQFLNALGPIHLHVRLESDDQSLTKNIGTKIIEELKRFVSGGDHLQPSDDGFGRAYPVLRGRGAWYRADPHEAPYFSASHGRSTVDRGSRKPVILDTLDRHRTSAVTYRHARNWCAIWITDVFDIARDTLSDLVLVPPPIDPFEWVFIANASGRVIAFERSGGNTVVTEVP